MENLLFSNARGVEDKELEREGEMEELEKIVEEIILALLSLLF